MTTAMEMVIARLPKEEGERRLPYDDKTGKRVQAPLGHISWGWGFNLEACGSPGLFAVMTRYLVEQVEQQIREFAWYKASGYARQSVLLDIAYNEGVEGLLHFPHMLSAIEKGDWKLAASECKVADPVLDKSRYEWLRVILETGEA